MFKNGIHIMFGLLFCLTNVSCVHSLARVDGPYEGRIIDADTRQPIEGVVVLGVWYKIASVGAGGAFREYYDAQETVTDKNGEFSIKGLDLKILSSVEPMNFLIFKTGYKYENGPWKSLKESFYYKDKIKWEGNKAIIPLRKLTMEERKKGRLPPYPPTEAMKEKKANLMMEEIYKERKEQGLD
jgi:hypothetical protein